MYWPVLAIITAFLWASADLFSKKVMEAGRDEYITLFSRLFFSIFPLAVFVIVNGVPRVSSKFWLVNMFIIPGDIIASTLYIKALKLSPISIVVPLMSFSPVFMLLTSSIILSEPPSLLGVIGVFFVALGSYVLNISDIKEGLLEPLKALVQKGPIMTIIAAFIFSIDSALGKKAIFYSDVFFFALFYSTAMTLFYIPIVLKLSKESISSFFKTKEYYYIGFLFALGVICFLYAMKLANIAYVSAVGKISMIIAVIYGKIFFNEKRIKERLAGAIIIFIGVLLILIGDLN